MPHSPQDPSEAKMHEVNMKVPTLLSGWDLLIRAGVPGRTHVQSKSKWQQRTEPQGAQRRQRVPQTSFLRTGKNQYYYGNHNGSCFANHNGSHAQSRRGPGDNARRSPFWRLWVLTAPATAESEGAQRRQRAQKPLSGGSGYCACLCRE